MISNFDIKNEIIIIIIIIIIKIISPYQRHTIQVLLYKLFDKLIL